jgi:hypothetical protein
MAGRGAPDLPRPSELLGLAPSGLGPSGLVPPGRVELASGLVGPDLSIPGWRGPPRSPNNTGPGPDFDLQRGPRLSKLWRRFGSKLGPASKLGPSFALNFGPSLFKL